MKSARAPHNGHQAGRSLRDDSDPQDTPRHPEWFTQQSELIEVKEVLQQSQAKQIELLKRSRDSELHHDAMARDLLLVEGILHSEPSCS
jgi:hypothetical protein